MVGQKWTNWPRTTHWDPITQLPCLIVRCMNYREKPTQHWYNRISIQMESPRRPKVTKVRLTCKRPCMRLASLCVCIEAWTPYWKKQILKIPTILHCRVSFLLLSDNTYRWIHWALINQDFRRWHLLWRFCPLGLYSCCWIDNTYQWIHWALKQ